VQQQDKFTIRWTRGERVEDQLPVDRVAGLDGQLGEVAHGGS
jgi:hypothetical protein